MFPPAEDSRGSPDEGPSPGAKVTQYFGLTGLGDQSLPKSLPQWKKATGGLTSGSESLQGMQPGVPSLMHSGSWVPTARMLAVSGSLAASGVPSSGRMAQPFNPLLKESGHNQGFAMGVPGEGQHLVVLGPLPACKFLVSSADGTMVCGSRISSWRGRRWMFPYSFQWHTKP